MFSKRSLWHDEESDWELTRKEVGVGAGELRLMQKARWRRLLAGDEARWDGEAAKVARELRCGCGMACSTQSWLLCCKCSEATACRAEVLTAACEAERAMREEVAANGGAAVRHHQQTATLVKVLRGEDTSEARQAVGEARRASLTTPP